MVKNAPLPEYITAMKKNSFTQNWDVAVTYEQDKINALLAERFQKPDHGMATNVKIPLSATDRYGKYTVWYDFDLGPPGIQFQAAGSPTCTLQTKITKGKYWSVDAKGTVTKPAEDVSADAYTITLHKIDLASVTGDEEVSGKTPQSGDKTVVFPDDKALTSHIVIDLPTSSDLEVTVDHSTIKEPPFEMTNVQLETALKDYFRAKISAIDYTLASVNSFKPTKGTLDLVPRAFRFTTMKISESLSYLSILIQTRSSEKGGNTDGLQSLWNASWTTADVSPVPAGQSASIILNNSFFFEVFVKPALAARNATVTHKKDANDSWATVNWPKINRDKVELRNDDYDPDQSATKQWSSASFDAVEIDPNSGSPLTLTFSQSAGADKPATVKIEWSYSVRYPWTGFVRWDEWNNDTNTAIQKAKKYYGAINITYSVNRTVNLTTINDESFTVNVGLTKNDWDLKVKMEDNSTVWDKIGDFLGFSGITVDGTNCPGFIKDGAVELIDFGFDFGTLRFFSLTNVLLPGSKVIDISIKDGLRAPRDFVIVGNVVKSLEPAK